MTLRLRQPPLRYDPQAERQRNLQIERAFNDKLDKQAIPVFPGVPVVKQTGTGTVVIASGSPALVALDTNVWSHPNLIDTTVLDPIRMLYTFKCQVHARVVVQTAGTGVTNTIALAVNDVVTYSCPVKMDIFNGACIEATFYEEFAQDDEIKLYYGQDSGGNVTVDRASSHLVVQQLSTLPVYSIVERLA